VFGKPINLAQFASLFIAHILMTLVCLISVRFIGLRYNLRLITSANKRTSHLRNQLSVCPVQETVDTNSIAAVLFPFTVSALHEAINFPDYVHDLIIFL